MIRVVISGLLFPLTMLHYFWRAFERRKDVELFVTGPFFGDYIPWKGGMTLPMRYVKQPQLPLPQGLANQSGLPADVIQSKLPWEPDLWLQVDAGWWVRKPKAKVVAHVATDPHVLNYSRQRTECDVFFNMQSNYSQSGDVWLPYAYDPSIHYPVDLPEGKDGIEYDACLIGLQYEHRTQLVNRLRASGLKVFYDTGIVYDEYRELYNRSRVAISWSSLQDTPTRIFESMAMKIPLVANYTPDLMSQFDDGYHYYGFDTVDQAERMVHSFLKEPDVASKVAQRAFDEVTKLHSWDHRVERILTVCNLI